MEQRSIIVCGLTAAASLAALLVVRRRGADVARVQTLNKLALPDNKGHLRPVAVADAAEILALVDANREHLAEWLPWVKYVNAVADERSE